MTAVEPSAQFPHGRSPQAGSGKRSRRLVAILGLVGEDGTLGLHRLVEELGVSVATVRRDLAELENQGLVTRTHGGARIAASAVEVPVRLRAGQSHRTKLLIARRAATFLPEGPYAVAIGGGTTAAAVARALMFRTELTIVTNSLTTAGEIGSRPNLRVVMTGGIVRPTSFELVGVLAENTFSAINVGTAFLGADGVSAAGGVTTHDETEARTNAAMIRDAQRTVVVADSSKIGRITLAQVADLSGVDDVVTDSGAPAEEVAALRARGPRVHVVEV